MTALYDWRSEGDFDDERTPMADAVRLALCQVAEGRLPTLGTLGRALGIGALRALAVRDHLAHLITARHAAEHDAEGGAERPGVAEPAPDPGPGTVSPAETSASVPAPDPACERALGAFAGVLAEGRVPSQRQIKTRLRVGGPRARRIQRYLEVHVRRAA